jgi:hypothetical protein
MVCLSFIYLSAKYHRMQFTASKEQTARVSTRFDDRNNECNLRIVIRMSENVNTKISYGFDI